MFDVDGLSQAFMPCASMPKSLVFSVSPLYTTYGRFRKLGVPYFGVLIIRILLFRVLYIRVPYFPKLLYAEEGCFSGTPQVIGRLLRYPKTLNPTVNRVGSQFHSPCGASRWNAPIASQAAQLKVYHSTRLSVIQLSFISLL